jgi:putative GTP pyrophosphokinase
MLKEDEFSSTFSQLAGDFERLRLSVSTMIRNALESAKIDTVSIESRVKGQESAFQKHKEKNYTNPFEENTDFVGVRVIVFLDRDIDKAASIVRDHFEVDETHSSDKRTPKQVDLVGYRFLHLVGKLGEGRKDLPEYESISNIYFEVQIRTILQHAWAEIEHKRRYKGKASLPNDLQHRLMIISGTLELIDREFSGIAIEADKYAEKLLSHDDHSSDTDAISEVAVGAIYERYLREQSLSGHSISNSGITKISEVIIGELMEFGVESVEDLKILVASLPFNFVDVVNKHNVSVTANKLYRTAMMAKDFDRYFSHGSSSRFDHVDLDNFNMLKEVLGKEDLEEKLREHGIEVIPF